MHEASSKVKLGRYTKVSVINRGTFSVVIKALDESASPPEVVALKVVGRGSSIRDFRTYLNREIACQASLRHPFIVPLKEVFLTNEFLVIVLEYVPGGDMVSYMDRQQPNCRLCEAEARWMFQQLVIGLQYCHIKGVANRDLKLENLLLDTNGEDGRRPLLKICDFGYCKHESNSSAKSWVGTPMFMSPEVLLGSNKYDAKKADVWSCGVILYTILHGTYPFDSKDPRFAIKVATADYKWGPDLGPDVHISPGCKDLIQLMLVAEPHARCEVDTILSHPWFLTDLPPQALEMNSHYLERSKQSGLDQEGQERLQALLELAGREHQESEEHVSVLLQ